MTRATDTKINPSAIFIDFNQTHCHYVTYGIHFSERLPLQSAFRCVDVVVKADVGNMHKAFNKNFLKLHILTK